MTTSLEFEAAKVGLRISSEKSKVMCVNRRTKARINVRTETIDKIHKFTYRGSIMTSDGGTEEDVKCRVGKATTILQRMRQISACKSINIAIKLRLFNTIILPTAIYVSETWKITAKVTEQLNVFQQRCLRSILGISYLDRITNEEVLHRSGSRRLQDIITERRMRLAGHVLRLPEHSHPRIAMN